MLFCMDVKIGLTHSDKKGLKLFNKRVPRRIFIPKMEKVTKQKNLHA
jgi:hypothetical protein